MSDTIPSDPALAAEWATRRERERCCEAVREEPELPGDMPDEMWDAIRNDRDAMAAALRITVQQTKQGILSRIG